MALDPAYLKFKYKFQNFITMSQKENVLKLSENESQDEISFMNSPLAGLVMNPDPSTPETCMPSLLTVKSANQWINEAFVRPDPVSLWMTMWHEGEISCLFADSNVGKSIYAVEIAAKISEREPVLYVDFELSDKQFQLRYTSDSGFTKLFPENFKRAEFKVDALAGDLTDLDSVVLESIETAARSIGATKIIIDNLSFICSNSDKSDLAGRFMIRLVDLKRRLGLSVLVLAHTPKRSLDRPITQNDLAGSKKLFNFFDSVFAIGKSARDEALRYIKQIKVRAGEFQYGTHNVIVAEIVKEGNWLHFNNIGYAEEEEHLRKEKDKERSVTEEKVKALREEGKSMSQVASLTGCSKTKVARICKKLGI